MWQWCLAAWHTTTTEHAKGRCVWVVGFCSTKRSKHNSQCVERQLPQGTHTHARTHAHAHTQSGSGINEKCMKEKNVRVCVHV